MTQQRDEYKVEQTSTVAALDEAVRTERTSKPARFVLLGFSQDASFRLYAFERQTADGSRTAFAVKTDVTMTRSLAIKLQDLPLLCRRVLESQPSDFNGPDLILTAEMLRLAIPPETAAPSKRRKSAAPESPANAPENAGQPQVPVHQWIGRYYGQK